MKRPKNTGGGLPLLALEEALGHEGCAVRGLVEQSGHGYLKTLLYEMVNDPGVQSAFRSSAGPCGRRAYRMLDLGDGLGAAILYQAAVKALRSTLSELDDGSPSSLSALPRRGTEAPAFPEPGSGCMACGVEYKAEDRYLGALLRGAEDGSLSGALEGPGVVCLRHLSRASALRDGRLPKTLSERASQRLAELEADLEIYVQHNDYRYRDEPWGKERDCLPQTVRFLYGPRQR